MAIAGNIQEEINVLVKRIYSTMDGARRQSQKVFKESAKPMVQAIQARAPVSDEPHDRYNGGKVVATYHSGNLRRSIKVLTFRRSKAVFVGAKLAEQGSGGVFRGNRTDGYYLHMVEFGTINQGPQPFFRPGVAQTKEAVLRSMVVGMKRQIDNYAQKYAQVRGR